MLFFGPEIALYKNPKTILLLTSSQDDSGSVLPSKLSETGQFN